MQLVIVKLRARNTEAMKVQEVLTKHGCNITLRLGVHEHGGQECSNEGIILLQVAEEPKAVKALVKDLKAIGKIVVKDLVI